ncbi:MAG: flavoprotein [Planctomycetota bacterium]
MRILLAISGGIAAYKGPELVRELRRSGHEVRCLLTAAARELVAPAALSTVSGHRVYESLWTADGSIPHIDLARWCQALLIAPATANCLAKCAHGFADDLLSTCFLALEPDRPVFIAPAMNSVMWQKAAVQENLAILRGRGATVLGPVSGNLACGEDGPGAMLPPAELAAALPTA